MPSVPINLGLYSRSGVQRSEAHRFYFANGYSISSHHFRRMITEGV